jgi:hypothetical protein
MMQLIVDMMLILIYFQTPYTFCDNIKLVQTWINFFRHINQFLKPK